MILFIHNRYRMPGGEERAVGDLAWLVCEHLGEEVERLERDSRTTGRAAAAAGLLRGGLDPGEVTRAVRRTGARIVHAHNLNPSFGPRALAAARAAGARTVLHLHNYRLICAVGTCVDPVGADCVRCHGRDTRPGLRHGCRGSRAEALTYAAALSAHAASLTAAADAIVVPSRAALTRLQELGAPLGATPVHVVPHVIRPPMTHGSVAYRWGQAPSIRGFALVVSRLAPEKAVDVAIEAARRAGVPLVIAGDGPQRTALERQAEGHDVTFLGRVDGATLDELRARAGVALAPTRAQETFGLAALEAMAAGLPTVATARGAQAELGAGARLVPPEDPGAMAQALLAVRGRPEDGERARRAAATLAAPDVVAPQLRAVYDAVAR